MSERVTGTPWRRRELTSGHGWMWATAAIAVALCVALLVWLGAMLGGTRIGNPVVAILSGHPETPWTAAATGWTAALMLAVLTVGIAVVLLRARGSRSGSPALRRVDRKAASMATVDDMALLLPKGAAADAARLKCDAGTGNPIAQLVRNGQPLRSSYEWTQAWIMGPRAGKTSCVCVRQVCETSGPVIATSNKRDLVDLTRGVREQQGHCWVFDPQDMIGAEPDWWWNPLSYVTDVQTATELVAIFHASQTDANARGDDYFGPRAKEYLRDLLLAAALAQEPITTVSTWISKPNDMTPVEVLRMAGFDKIAQTLISIISLNSRQRDGIIDTAANMVGWLDDPRLWPWITSKPGDDRPQFNPADFVASRQTLYLISKEGAGSARALTAALTVATIRAGEKLGSRQRGGRLAVPLTVVLDEAANVVRWPDLPKLYSHFGSRGIVVSSFFQSWDQGVNAYGLEGMNALWSAANVRVVGAGVAEAKFLEDWSKLIGDHDVISVSQSHSPGKSGSGRSTSRSLRRERVFEPSELAAMPTGRAVMLAAGMPAGLIKLTHWSQTSYAEQVKASEEHFTAAP